MVFSDRLRYQTESWVQPGPALLGLWVDCAQAILVEPPPVREISQTGSLETGNFESPEIEMLTPGTTGNHEVTFEHEAVCAAMKLCQSELRSFLVHVGKEANMKLTV